MISHAEPPPLLKDPSKILKHHVLPRQPSLLRRSCESLADKCFCRAQSRFRWGLRRRSEDAGLFFFGLFVHILRLRKFIESDPFAAGLDCPKCPAVLLFSGCFFCGLGGSGIFAALIFNLP